ncbi:DUF4350 domain-containing protein [Actinoplanes sp. DH11]|uniref:DUF4350 domain-containing protein n=1 Tax=Actinoplanes sp. DH11 TaxID=2857011 RepID=UPI001E2B2678|nr:DUF4350 domain-containing protein [Actinoplanes sp. DH11]
MRVILPFTAMAVLIGGTLLAHAVEQPDPGDAAYLDPASERDIGGGRLAAALRARGTTVETAATTGEAIERVRERAGTTLFIPVPSFVDLRRLSLTGFPAGTRLVLVAAERRDLDQTAWPVRHAGTRWAARAVGADCALPLLPGPAAVQRQEYASDEHTVCYHGGLVSFDDGEATVVLVGAADPFRNDRITEHANEAFATAMLGGGRVVWLDLHEWDDSVPADEEESSATPSAEPSDGESLPELPPPPGAGGEGAPDQAQAPEPEDPPLTDAFPPSFWATLLLAAIALLALAAAGARRLGTPVAEPLPSRVPAHETMLGHARLYQRARARGPSLDVLRSTARRRLAAHLGLPPDASSTELAGHAGLPPERVRAVLDGGVPQTDADLVAAARNVQNLVRDVTRRAGAGPATSGRPPTSQGREGEPS